MSMSVICNGMWEVLSFIREHQAMVVKHEVRFMCTRILELITILNVYYLHN